MQGMQLQYWSMSSTSKEVLVRQRKWIRYKDTTVIWIFQWSYIQYYIRVCSCRMMLLLEECPLCYGVVVVSFMGKMKLNLQNLVSMDKNKSSSLHFSFTFSFVFFLILLQCFHLFIFPLGRWVPPWSWRIFCN